jgi:hypothetical protein
LDYTERHQADKLVFYVDVEAVDVDEDVVDAHVGADDVVDVGGGRSLPEQNHPTFSSCFDCQARKIRQKSCEVKPIPLLQTSRVKMWESNRIDE